MPKPKYVSHFQSFHAIEYGMKVSAHDSSSGKVSSVVCRFCTTFGREENVGGKRARTNNVKYFNTFRTDGYKRHLGTAHAEQWTEYQRILTDEGKEQFFKNIPVAFVNRLDAHLENQGNHIRVLINGTIVETVLGDLLFNPDDIESMSRERALQQFKKLDAPEPKIGEEGGRHEMSKVVIKTPR
ncbi:hypothetical protein Mp_2g11970 [Marchantia polymorpha subsp. ruderalis]|uniref:Uncharacterized protein n=1 Tax=Marchantia polymorpha TaxID=3197 RepID=A0A2R6XCM8_MARPO|nr:hypothetical protein MARPO_0023s0162 [Marchantia polymorpha]BBN02006.1 hypothetical protein Mp_2g11970 [Marchantia polymorpha subsp. ruderalis]|eukprot:PTQ43868.1 hypothetical protein MARPO_0023s0162 [Marchantia polymorpha]